MDESHSKTMLEAFEEVADPRKRRGIRYPWRLLLGLIVAAMVSGNGHGRAIAQWVRELADKLKEVLELEGGRLPTESTLRRALSRMNQAHAKVARMAMHLATLPLPKPVRVATLCPGANSDGGAVCSVHRVVWDGVIAASLRAGPVPEARPGLTLRTGS